MMSVEKWLRRDTADIVKKLDNRKLCPEFKNGVLWATGRLEGCNTLLERQWPS